MEDPSAPRSRTDAAAPPPPPHAASSERIPHPSRKRHTSILSPRRLLLSLQSEPAQLYLEVARLFAIAYAPYLLLPPLLVLLLASQWLHLHPALNLSICALLALARLLSRPPTCYLVDFASFKSVPEHQLSTEVCEFLTAQSPHFTSRNLLFQLKVLLKSGLGDETYGPGYLFKEGGKPTLGAAREETEHLMYGALDELFFKTAVNPSEVDVLIVNVSMFYPVPSLSAHLVNHYKMRDDVKSYNISGMGCAAGMVAVDMARDLLRVHKNSYVVIVGTENITLNWYYGNDRSMLVPNCLFRCGSYALLLSNKEVDRSRSKFELLHSVRTTRAADDKAYNCIVTREDDQGVVGTSLSVKLVDVASQALLISLTKLVPVAMPFSELLKAGVNAMRRKLLRAEVKPYLPDFKRAFTHFCIHPGGRAVVDGIGRSLKLTDYDLEPARMTLHRFGNTSSSGLWYEMAYCEAKRRLKKGDKVWQAALGSGFKCNSVVWRALRDVIPTAGRNPWMDCIHRYPVEVPDTILPTNPFYEVVKKYEERLRDEESRARADH